MSSEQVVTDDNPVTSNQASLAVSNALIAGLNSKREKHGEAVLIRDGWLFDGGLSSILDSIAAKCSTKLGVQMTSAVLQVRAYDV
jgi:hypothetical protein